MKTKGKMQTGLKTRFGTNKPGFSCVALTNSEGECKRPAMNRTGNCARHDDKLKGPWTQAGGDKLEQLHMKHEKYTKEKRHKFTQLSRNRRYTNGVNNRNAAKTSGSVMCTPELDEPTKVASIREEYCVESVINASRWLRKQVEAATTSAICVEYSAYVIILQIIL